MHHVTINRLQVPLLRRQDLNSTFRCQAANTKLILPTERSVRLEMNLRPMSVKLLGTPGQFIAGEKYSVACEVLGSRPQAQVTWTRGERKFRKGKPGLEKIEEASNATWLMSTLTFTPTPDDHNTQLSCRGDNLRLPGHGLEDTIHLDVLYSPLVTLTLGSTLNPEDIKEGDDVYFECHVRANPKEHRITWYHNDRLVTQNVSTGVILSTRSLVLQRVLRHDAGEYSCLAANERGETASQPVPLRVQYAPVCSTSPNSRLIGASQDESLRIRCDVTSDPLPEDFVWQFNNSGESLDVSSRAARTPPGGTRSILSYKPAGERDFGTLSCWGRNAIGKQTEPCVFQVVPAAKPFPPRNCSLAPGNLSAVLEVQCVAGYDGGLPQQFLLEAYDTRTMRLRLNLTSTSEEQPIFRLDLTELLPGSSSGPSPTLHIAVFAQNQKGRSELTLLENIALDDAEKITDGDTGLSLAPLFAVLAGALLALTLAAVAVRRRLHEARNGRRGGPNGGVPSSGANHHGGGGGSVIGAGGVKSQQTTTATDKILEPPDQLLEINSGEQRYVLAYTLKRPDAAATMTAPAEPDILSAQRDNIDPPVRPAALFSTRDVAMLDRARQGDRHAIPGLGGGNSPPLWQQSRPWAIPGKTSDHITTDTIPGPESCV